LIFSAFCLMSALSQENICFRVDCPPYKPPTCSPGTNLRVIPGNPNIGKCCITFECVVPPQFPPSPPPCTSSCHISGNRTCDPFKEMRVIIKGSDPCSCSQSDCVPCNMSQCPHVSKKLGDPCEREGQVVLAKVITRDSCCPQIFCGCDPAYDCPSRKFIYPLVCPPGQVPAISRPSAKYLLQCCPIVTCAHPNYLLNSGVELHRHPGQVLNDNRAVGDVGDVVGVDDSLAFAIQGDSSALGTVNSSGDKVPAFAIALIVVVAVIFVALVIVTVKLQLKL